MENEKINSQKRFNTEEYSLKISESVCSIILNSKNEIFKQKCFELIEKISPLPVLKMDKEMMVGVLGEQVTKSAEKNKKKKKK